MVSAESVAAHLAAGNREFNFVSVNYDVKRPATLNWTHNIIGQSIGNENAHVDALRVLRSDRSAINRHHDWLGNARSPLEGLGTEGEGVRHFSVSAQRSDGQRGSISLVNDDRLTVRRCNGSVPNPTTNTKCRSHFSGTRRRGEQAKSKQQCK